MRELRQQRVLVKPKIPTPKLMIQVDKEFERQKLDIERSKAITKWKMLLRIDDQDKDTSSSVSMYDIDSNDEGSKFVSSRTPSIVRQITPPLVNDKEIKILPITKKIYSERHCSVNSVILEEEHPSSYNIEEIFGSFTFNLHRREVSRKKFRKVKQVDGTMREIHEDEVKQVCIIYRKKMNNRKIFQLIVKNVINLSIGPISNITQTKFTKNNNCLDFPKSRTLCNSPKDI